MTLCQLTIKIYQFSINKIKGDMSQMNALGDISQSLSSCIMDMKKDNWKKGILGV